MTLGVRTPAFAAGVHAQSRGILDAELPGVQTYHPNCERTALGYIVTGGASNSPPGSATPVVVIVVGGTVSQSSYAASGSGGGSSGSFFDPNQNLGGPETAGPGSNPDVD